ncbi:enoyl-CoA hydratase/isomerase family protein [Shinella sp. BYT-45]|uniref:enoyl-CoA hydratase/isomerase family protein n=1 Tax=Shinella sp. BYT-45 TaxID=3377377 RepID=UPI00397F16C1
MERHEDIRFERRGSAAIVRLDRPRALNSLTLPMVRAMKDALALYAGDASVTCVVLTGEGERGLCAGGDVRIIHDLGRRGDPEALRFWREEFPLNAAIARYPKPYVALMDGITMGGGVGIAAHGSVRIVTERTRLAMPETGIGYFPDVGATWLLPRAPGEAGTWMGLTGNEVGAADAIHAGLADHLVPSARLADLMEALAALPAGAARERVVATAAGFAMPAEGGVLAANGALIDRTFRFDAVAQIVAALEAEHDPFAAETLAVLRRRSPTSLKLALRLLRLGRASRSLEACLEREFAAAAHVLTQHDFYEGVRAALVDKDRDPKWSPASLDAVPDAAIEAYLAESEPLFRTR